MSDITYYIVEVDSGLPDHWSTIGVTSDGRRVMKEKETESEAQSYIESNYGMYRDDAVVISSDDIEIQEE